MPPLKRLKTRSELDPSYVFTRQEPSPPPSLIIKLPVRFQPLETPPITPHNRKINKPKVHFQSPLPKRPRTDTEPDTIHKVRQQCWLLDQIRIYAPIAAEQRAEIARFEDETGEWPDLESFKCPYILSEFSIEERHRVGLPEDEELEFLLDKRAELEREIFGEEGMMGDDDPEYGGKEVDGDEGLGDGVIDVDATDYVGADEVWDRPTVGGKSLAAVQRASFPLPPSKGQAMVVKKPKRRKRRVSFDGNFVPEPLEDDVGVHIKPKRKPRAQKATTVAKKPAGTKKSAGAAKKIAAMDGVDEDSETEDGEFVPEGKAKPKKRQTLLTAGSFGKVTKNWGGGRVAIKGNINLSFRK